MTAKFPSPQSIIFNLDAHGDVSIGHWSIIGSPDKPDDRVQMLGQARIGRFCIVEGDVQIGDRFVMDDYCAVYASSRIGTNVKLLYGKKIFGRSKVGDNCIIGGNIPERCLLSDNVTFMGEVAHSHYDPTSDWDTTDEPSPTIGYGSVVGVNALIIGGISIGSNCYVSAGEILRHDLPDNTVFIKGQVFPISHFKGMLRTRAT